MKLAYYRRIGLSNGKADGRKARRLDCQTRNLANDRLDSLDCEIYAAELDAYLLSYREGWYLFQKNFSPL